MDWYTRSNRWKYLIKCKRHVLDESAGCNCWMKVLHTSATRARYNTRPMSNDGGRNDNSDNRRLGIKHLTFGVAAQVF